MRRNLTLAAIVVAATVYAGPGNAQQPGRDIPVPQTTTCPPGTSGGPTIGSNQNDQNLSDQLAQSRGVICPPAGVDNEIHVPAPGGGRTPIIAPSGGAGGGAVQPK